MDIDFCKPEIIQNLSLKFKVKQRFKLFKKVFYNTSIFKLDSNNTSSQSNEK